MRKAMMMVTLVLVLATAAHASDSRPSDPVTGSTEVAPARAVTAASEKVPAKEVARPAPGAEPEEFAGTTMLRFFWSSVEASTDVCKTTPVTAGTSIQVAAY